MATGLNGRVVLFGGFGSNDINNSTSNFNDTSEWDGSRWTNVTPATNNPVERVATAMSNGLHGRIVLFGGNSPGISGIINDTWEYSLDNNAPVNSVPLAHSTSEDVPLVFSVTGSNALSVSDADDSFLSVTLSVANGAGTLSLSRTAGLSFTSGDGTSDATMTFSGDANNINAALNGLRFDPTANFNGAALTVSSSDGALSDSDTVAIMVGAVNDAPIAASDVYATRGPLTVSAARGVLLNDLDPDRDPLRAVILTAPRGGTLRLNADGSFVYTPNVTFSGRDTFTYRATDGKLFSAAATVAITVALGPDITPPVVTLLGDAPLVRRALTAPRGLASDVTIVTGRPVVASGLASVKVRLQRADGQFYNGRAFGRGVFEFTATLSGTTFFLPPNTVPPASLTLDGRYLITATATDRAGLRKVDTQTVIVDAPAPVLQIVSPAAGASNTASVTRLSMVSGTATGAARVEVSLRNAAGLFFNGRGFASSPVSLPATLIGSTWVLNLPPSVSRGLGRYTITVRAFDAAGNLGNVANATRIVVVTSTATG